MAWFDNILTNRVSVAGTENPAQVDATKIADAPESYEGVVIGTARVPKDIGTLVAPVSIGISALSGVIRAATDPDVSSLCVGEPVKLLKEVTYNGRLTDLDTARMVAKNIVPSGVSFAILAEDDGFGVITYRIYTLDRQIRKIEKYETDDGIAYSNFHKAGANIPQGVKVVELYDNERTPYVQTEVDLEPRVAYPEIGNSVHCMASGESVQLGLNRFRKIYHAYHTLPQSELNADPQVDPSAEREIRMRFIDEAVEKDAPVEKALALDAFSLLLADPKRRALLIAKILQGDVDGDTRSLAIYTLFNTIPRGIEGADPKKDTNETLTHLKELGAASGRDFIREMKTRTSGFERLQLHIILKELGAPKDLFKEPNVINKSLSVEREYRSGFLDSSASILTGFKDMIVEPDKVAEGLWLLVEKSFQFQTDTYAYLYDAASLGVTGQHLLSEDKRKEQFGSVKEFKVLVEELRKLYTEILFAADWFGDDDEINAEHLGKIMPDILLLAIGGGDKAGKLRYAADVRKGLQTPRLAATAGEEKLAAVMARLERKTKAMPTSAALEKNVVPFKSLEPEEITVIRDKLLGSKLGEASAATPTAMSAEMIIENVISELRMNWLKVQTKLEGTAIVARISPKHPLDRGSITIKFTVGTPLEKIETITKRVLTDTSQFSGGVAQEISIVTGPELEKLAKLYGVDANEARLSGLVDKASSPLSYADDCPVIKIFVEDKNDLRSVLKRAHGFVLNNTIVK